MGNTLGDKSEDLIEEDGKSGLGPLGLGDPDDLTLRHQEVSSLIPKYHMKAIDADKCLETWKAFRRCADESALPMFSCEQEFKVYSECSNFWINNSDHKNQIIEEYLAIRTEYRKTGRRRLKRALQGETYVSLSQLRGIDLKS